VDELREINHSRTGKRLNLTKGVHIVVAREALPVKQAIYFNVDDGRMIFAIPRSRTTYIGTTDTNYSGDKDHVVTSKSDAEYLVHAVNATFPSVNLTLQDIESSWAGLRPLIHEEGKSASELSRKDEIFESPTGLISIAGGKLTGYRKMAERVVDMASGIYFRDRKLRETHTDEIGITDPAFKDYPEVLQYIHKIEGHMNPEGFTSFTAHYLVKNYGPQVDEILGNYKRGDHKEDPELRLLKAELLFAVQKEMVCTLEDFFIRRTGLLYFNAPLVDKWKSFVADALKKYLETNDDVMQQQLLSLEETLFKARNFD
jgi:glycerol-3-phosphate dehydrogenase